MARRRGKPSHRTSAGPSDSGITPAGKTERSLSLSARKRRRRHNNCTLRKGTRLEERTLSYLLHCFDRGIEARSQPAKRDVFVGRLGGGVVPVHVTEPSQSDDIAEEMVVHCWPHTTLLFFCVAGWEERGEGVGKLLNTSDTGSDRAWVRAACNSADDAQTVVPFALSFASKALALVFKDLFDAEAQNKAVLRFRREPEVAMIRDFGSLHCLARVIFSLGDEWSADSREESCFCCSCCWFSSSGLSMTRGPRARAVLFCE